MGGIGLDFLKQFMVTGYQLTLFTTLNRIGPEKMPLSEKVGEGKVDAAKEGE
jgi:predicted aconitase